MILYTTYYFKINTNISRNILKSCIYFPRKNTQEMLNNLSEKHEEYKNFTPLISAILNVPIVVDPVPQDDDRAFQNPKIPMFQCSREDPLTFSAKNDTQIREAFQIFRPCARKIFFVPRKALKTQDDRHNIKDIIYNTKSQMFVSAERGLIYLYCQHCSSVNQNTSLSDVTYFL